MGNDPGNAVLESPLSGLGLQEPVRRGLGAFREQCEQKPDTHDLALAWRTGEYIADQVKKRDL